MSGGFPNLGSVSGGTSYYIDSSHIWSGLQGPTPNAAANTKGSWLQLIASTSADAALILVQLDLSPQTNGHAHSTDIGIGAAGSEIVIAPDFLSTGSSGWGSNNFWAFPCLIPAGTRVATRTQYDSASGPTGNMTITLYDSDFAVDVAAVGIDTIGFVSAATTGTTIDPGAGPNAKGSYTQLTASTSRDYCGIMAIFDSLANTTNGGDRVTVDIAIGGAGSETIIVPDWFVSTYGAGAIATTIPTLPYTPINIPAGSRVSARAASSNATAGTRIFGLTLYGFYK